jgi:hypothetical protein
MNGTSRPDRATLSEVAHRPCPDADDQGDTATGESRRPGLRVVDLPPSGTPDHLRFARLVKPFPIKRLPTVLHQVLAGAHVIDAKITRLLIDGVWSPEEWHAELDQIGVELYALAQACQQADAALDELHDQGDRDFEQAISAVAGMLRGLP